MTQIYAVIIGVLFLAIGYFYICNKDLKKKMSKLTDVLQSVISRPAEPPAPQPKSAPTPVASEPEEVEYEEVEVEEEEEEA